METAQSPGELSVKLLWNIANALPAVNHTTNLLRSFYLTTCRRIAKYDVKLPAANFAPSVMCQKCSSIWSESKFGLTLRPRRIHSKKSEKLVDKLNNDSNNLTRKQKKRAKWLRKKICNNVEVKCEFCQKKTLQKLIKPKVKPQVEETVAPEVIVSFKKKKKKKSKDKLAGLKLEKAKPQVKTENLQTKASKIKGQPSKQKAQKAVSKTQKTNSLLQLAYLLKKQTATSSTNNNNQLDKFLSG